MIDNAIVAVSVSAAIAALFIIMGTAVVDEGNIPVGNSTDRLSRNVAARNINSVVSAVMNCVVALIFG